jgi:hypothetical protein
MSSQNDKNVVIENARLVFLNFAGKEGQYNREGDRNFAVLLDDGVAQAMANDGWLIKTLKPYEGGDPEQPYLPVSLRFDIFPPRIVLLTSRGRTNVGEEEVELLDWADIKTVDLIVRPYSWTVGGKTGVKAYLKSMFVTIEEDPLELKYSDIR